MDRSRHDGRGDGGHLLDAGHELTVHNRTREREEALAARGASRAATPREAARGRRARVPVRVGLARRRGDRAGRRRHRRGHRAAAPCVLDCSTIAPDTSRRVAADAGRARRRRGRRARLGRLRGRAQGTADGLRRRRGRARRDRAPGARGVLPLDHAPRRARARARPARPSTRCSSRAPTPRSARGSRWARSEGLPLEALVEALGGGAAGSWILENRSGNVISGSYPLGFRMALHLKDLRIALAEADRLGLPMEVTRLVAEQAQRLVDAGHGDEDSSSLARVARGEIALVIERYLQIRAATVAGHLPVGRARLPRRRHRAAAALARRARRPARAGHVRERARHRRAASPSEERWVIARDAGGNERHALFAIDATGGPELPLSDDPDAIHVPGRVLARRPRCSRSRTPAATASTSTSRSSAVDGGGRRELAQPGGWSHVVDWSEHGILVQRANTPFDHDLFLVDPESGDARPPHAARRRGRLRLGAPAAPTAPCSAPATRAASSRAWRCCAHGAEPEFLTPDDGDVEIVALDARARAARVGVNRGGESEVWLDGARLEGLPGGVVSALALRARRLADDHGRPARRLDRRLDGRAGRRAGARARPSAALDRAGFVRPVLERGRELRRPPHPVPALRPGGPPRAVLGARRARVAVPAADGARDPVPRARRASPSPRPTCAARRATAAPTTTSTTSSGGSTRSRDLAALGRGARRRRRARRSASWAAPTAAT